MTVRAQSTACKLLLAAVRVNTNTWLRALEACTHFMLSTESSSISVTSAACSFVPSITYPMCSRPAEALAAAPYFSSSRVNLQGQPSEICLAHQPMHGLCQHAVCTQHDCSASPVGMLHLIIRARQPALNGGCSSKLPESSAVGGCTEGQILQQLGRASCGGSLSCTASCHKYTYAAVWATSVQRCCLDAVHSADLHLPQSGDQCVGLTCFVTLPYQKLLQLHSSTYWCAVCISSDSSPAAEGLGAPLHLANVHLAWARTAVGWPASRCPQERALHTVRYPVRERSCQGSRAAEPPGERPPAPS